MNGRNVPLLGLAMVAMAAQLARDTAVGLAWDATHLTHRARQIRPVCTLRGHHMPTLVACTRCGTPYNRVRDAGRPR